MSEMVSPGLPGVARRGSRREIPTALRYPPLVIIVISIIVAVMVLPSALNQPQTSPTETAEFAPVPPSNGNPPPGGNFADLGLAGSSTVTDVTSPQQQQNQPPPPPAGLAPPSGQGDSPPGLRCVAGHQTEDPLSPPCDPVYTGNNGGATYAGVTGSEIRVIVYLEGNDCTSFGFETNNRPDDTYFDFDLPPSQSSSNSSYPESMSIWAPAMRDLDKFFNQHFQMYHRHVHMRLWHGTPPTTSEVAAGVNCSTAAERQADAAAEFQAFHPFAVINLAQSYATSYSDYMNQHGVLDFIDESRLTISPAIGVPQSSFTKYPGLVWSYLPSMESWAKWVSDFLCKKMDPYPVSYTGNPTDQGKKRVWGLVEGAADTEPIEYNQFANLITNDVKQECNISWAAVENVESPGYNLSESPNNPPTYAQQGMANMRTAGVTTVFWAGGNDDYTTRAAQGYGYFPEWIVAGDRAMDAEVGGFFQQPSEWKNAFTVSNVEKYPNNYNQQCYLAYQDADPQAGAPGSTNAYIACQAYADFRLLWTGIQVAGPHLTPQSMDQGYHAIPKSPSNNPGEVTCFFNTGDYNCIKDAEYMWWDPSAIDPDSNQGCYRMVEGGKRWVEGRWDPGQLTAVQNKNSDPCNAYT